MKIDPVVLTQLLKMAGLPKGTKPLIDPILFDFREKGVFLRQTDDAKVVGVLGVLKPELFAEYEAVGPKLVPFTVYKILKDAFKGVAEVKLQLTDEEIVIESDTAAYREKLMNVEVSEVGIDKIKPCEYGIISKVTEPSCVYQLEAELLNVLKYEEVTFEYGDTLQVIFESETSAFRKSIKVKPIVSEGEGHVTIFTDYIARVLKNVSGVVYLIFTKQGPMYISKVADKFVITYAIAPKEVEESAE